MAVDLSGLAAYTEENSGILISKALLGADIMNYVSVKPGYAAGTVAINVLDLDGLTFSAADCGWTDAGTVTFTQIDVTILDKQMKFSMCPKDFRDYWLSTQINPSAHNDVIPFEQFIADETVKKIQRQADKLVCDAILARVTTGNGAIDQFAATGVTAADWVVGNALDQAQALVSAIPAEVLDRQDLVMYMSYPSYRALTQDMVAENLFHYAPADTGTGTPQTQSQIIPGTNVKAIPFIGWGTAHKVICGPMEYIITAIGLLDDLDRLDIWYSKDNDEVRFLAKFRLGTTALAEYFATNGRT